MVRSDGIRRGCGGIRIRCTSSYGFIRTCSSRGSGGLEGEHQCKRSFINESRQEG
jgi:hypothetical protein